MFQPISGSDYLRYVNSKLVGSVEIRFLAESRRYAPFLSER